MIPWSPRGVNRWNTNLSGPIGLRLVGVYGPLPDVAMGQNGGGVLNATTFMCIPAHIVRLKRGLWKTHPRLDQMQQRIEGAPHGTTS